MIGIPFCWGEPVGGSPGWLIGLAGGVAARAIVAAGVAVHNRLAAGAAGKFAGQIVGVCVVASVTGESVNGVEFRTAIGANIFSRHFVVSPFGGGESCGGFPVID
jgi:hypothetical protein